MMLVDSTAEYVGALTLEGPFCHDHLAWMMVMMVVGVRPTICIRSPATLSLWADVATIQ